jgi:RND superfamily putative drug exporter
LLAAIVLVALAVPALGLPQLKENFDVLNELPAGAESRVGFETLSQHLAEGQLMPLTVLVKAPVGASTEFTSEQGLAAVGALEQSIAALPDIQSVRSVVDPLGEGKISDVLKPSIQLSQIAAGFRKPPSADINVQLGDASLAGIESAASYVDGLAKAFAILPGPPTLIDAQSDIATLQSGLIAARAQALVPNQLDAILKQVQAAVSGGSASAGDTATQLAALKSYLDELGGAHPGVKSVAAYQSAANAVGVLAASSNPVAFAQLVGSLGDLSTWFKTQPAAFYFAPSSVKPTADQVSAQQAMAAARTRLPDELDQFAAMFKTDLYAPPDLRSAYISDDGTVARLYVTTTTNPYDTKSFQTVRDLRALLATDPGHFGALAISLAEPRNSPGGGSASSIQSYVGGSTAEFADVQDTISADFMRVAAITIAGILIVLILLLRALVAPIYLVLTVLLSYAMSLSVSAIILQHLFGQPGMNYFIPLMVFVLLVALGSDYNIFLMSRVREESATRGLLPGIRVASARTGTVITSAGLILAGTFGALVTSPLQLLFQVGLAVALGVLIDTFVVRSLLVPAITAFVGERAWWPFHRRGE